MDKKRKVFCNNKCKNEHRSRESKEVRICLECGSEFEERKKHERKLCSDECRTKWMRREDVNIKRMENVQKTVKNKYGTDNVFQLESIKEKSKETKLDRYGDENYCNREQVKKTKIEKYGEDYFKNFFKRVKESMEKNYGVSHPLHVQKFIEKKMKTSLERYGTEHACQNNEVIEKFNKTIQERYGVDNISQNEEIKEKKKQTSINNFGVSHHLKDYDMFQKHLKSQYKTEEYKCTGLNFQGSYEYLFLQKMEEAGLIDQVRNGKSYSYIFDGVEHTYHTDFLLNGINIEIKSGWTYDNNGKNKKLQSQNDAKFKSVLDYGDSIIVLFSKKEIEDFVKNIKIE